MSNDNLRSLVNRMAVVQDSGVFSKSYTKDYLEMYPQDATRLDAIRNVWNFRGLAGNEDIIERFETVAQSLKAS